jgi:hypothetical protein
MPATYDDVETLVQSRRLADQIVRELEATQSRPMPFLAAAPPPPFLEPEELLPPPSLPPSNIFEQSWSTTTPFAAAPAFLRRPEGASRKRRKSARKSRSHLHWAVLAMCVAIAVGLWRDPTARVNAQRQLTTETHRVVKAASAKLGAAKSAAAAEAKRVSARII